MATACSDLCNLVADDPKIIFTSCKSSSVINNMLNFYCSFFDLKKEFKKCCPNADVNNQTKMCMEEAIMVPVTASVDDMLNCILLIKLCLLAFIANNIWEIYTSLDKKWRHFALGQTTAYNIFQARTKWFPENIFPKKSSAHEAVYLFYFLDIPKKLHYLFFTWNV